LTLAGARRRLEEASPRPADEREAEMDEVLDTLGADARARIAFVRGGLRSILDVLSKTPGSSELAELHRAVTPVDRRDRPSGRPERMKATKARPRAVRGKSSPSKRGGGAKRKRASA
jgi:hypothetical protein